MKRFALYILLLSLTLLAKAQDIQFEDLSNLQCEDTCMHIHGIDISHYQERINWETLSENRHIAYIYIKASEGGNNVDNRYLDNIKAAKKAGMKVGSYHFFRPKTPVMDQFNNFTSLCKAEEQDLLPLIDIETKGGLSDSAFIDSLTLFINKIEQHYKAKPLLYTGTNFYNKYLAGGMLDNYRLMIAQYTETPPELADGRDITIWQYTGKGSIEGIRGFVDKSMFMGNHSMRDIRYAHRNKQKKPVPKQTQRHQYTEIELEEQ